MTNRPSIELMEEVNPVFTTAQACLLVMAEAGDANAKKLVSALGFDRGISSVGKDELTEMEKFQKMKVIPGFTTMIEARFKASSNLFRSSRIKNMVDLPCGYTPRGLDLAQRGISYHGCDLPAVIHSMSSACSQLYEELREELHEGDSSLSYHPVDATNYDSLRTALKGVEGQLFITTEGLLMYLSQSELEEVFCNILRLLEEFGGMWVTTDNTVVSIQEKVMQAINSGTEKPDMAKKSPKVENIFFDENKAEEFIRSMGFSLEKTPVYDYLPDQLKTLAGYSEEIQRKAKEALGQMDFWIMRSDPDSKKYITILRISFRWHHEGQAILTLYPYKEDLTP